MSASLEGRGPQRVDALLIGAEELENLAARYLTAMLRQHGFSVELAPFSTAADMEAVLRSTGRARRPA